MGAEKNPTWNEARRGLLRWVAISTLVVAALAYGIWGGRACLASVSALLCLALGFYFTEGLIGVFTGTRRANPTVITILVLGKFGWWAGILVAAQRLPKGLEKPIALGMTAFLFALVVSAVLHFGMPRISDGNSHPGS